MKGGETGFRGYLTIDVRPGCDRGRLFPAKREADRILHLSNLESVFNELGIPPIADHTR